MRTTRKEILLYVRIIDWDYVRSDYQRNSDFLIRLQIDIWGIEMAINLTSRRIIPFVIGALKIDSFLLDEK
jgi:hypothetical protein